MNPLIVALDYPDISRARGMASDLVDYVGGFKVGLELILSEGPSAVDRIAGLGRPVFADVKLCDIPNTVKSGAAAMARRGARWITAHASGGRAMLEAAIEATDGTDTGVLAVTVLTSLGSSELGELGVEGGAYAQVARLARLAAECGVEGTVCAPDEIGAVRSVASGLSVFTPGIRPVDAEPDDQARHATPGEAVRLGADFLVVGRPVTRAADPAAAAQTILDEIAATDVSGST